MSFITAYSCLYLNASVIIIQCMIILLSLKYTDRYLSTSSEITVTL